MSKIKQIKNIIEQNRNLTIGEMIDNCDELTSCCSTINGKDTVKLRMKVTKFGHDVTMAVEINNIDPMAEIVEDDEDEFDQDNMSVADIMDDLAKHDLLTKLREYESTGRIDFIEEEDIDEILQGLSSGLFSANVSGRMADMLKDVYEARVYMKKECEEETSDETITHVTSDCDCVNMDDMMFSWSKEPGLDSIDTEKFALMCSMVQKPDCPVHIQANHLAVNRMINELRYEKLEPDKIESTVKLINNTLNTFYDSNFKENHEIGDNDKSTTHSASHDTQVPTTPCVKLTNVDTGENFTVDKKLLTGEVHIELPRLMKLFSSIHDSESDCQAMNHFRIVMDFMNDMKCNFNTELEKMYIGCINDVLSNYSEIGVDCPIKVENLD